VNVKLYVFDKKTQSWIELGLGPLRLNDRCLPSDSDSFQSRLGWFIHHLSSLCSSCWCLCFDHICTTAYSLL